MTFATALADADAVYEDVACLACGSTRREPFIEAEDDLTGRPGRFTFVRCSCCALVYQHPRLTLAHIADFYDDAYIAHRRTDWGPLAPFFERAMTKLDAAKERIVREHMPTLREVRVLDVGCGAGSFLQRLVARHGAHATGIDFKDLSSSPSLRDVEFYCSTFPAAPLTDRRFDLVTMWHFLEHDYDPLASLRRAGALLDGEGRLVIEVPRLDSRTFRWFGDRWPGLQAPQHTVLFDRAHLLSLVDRAGLEVVEYLPYGAFPAYFYLFTGLAFRLLGGRGLNLRRAIIPYFAGQLLSAPILLFERRLNLAMQTVICRRRP